MFLCFIHNQDYVIKNYTEKTRIDVPGAEGYTTPRQINANRDGPPQPGLFLGLLRALWAIFVGWLERQKDSGFCCFNMLLLTSHDIQNMRN